VIFDYRNLIRVIRFFLIYFTRIADPALRSERNSPGEQGDLRESFLIIKLGFIVRFPGLTLLSGFCAFSRGAGSLKKELEGG